MKKLYIGIISGLLAIFTLIPMVVFGASHTYNVDDGSLGANHYNDINLAITACTNGTDNYTINLYKDSTLTSTVSGKNITINISAGNTLTISSGNYSNLDIKGSGNLKITGGTFNYLDITGSVNISVSGGTISNSTIFSIEKSSTETEYYSSLLTAIQNVPKNKYSTLVKMYGDFTSDITIAGNQNVSLNLNGYKLGNTDKYILNYGNLLIFDDTNVESGNNISVANGTVKSKICNSGSLTLKTGKYNYKRVYYNKTQAQNDTAGTGGKDLTEFVFKSPNEEMEQSSLCYELDSAYYVISAGNLNFYLSCEVYDNKGNLVKSTDSDTIKDVSIGEKYITKIYIKSDSKYDVRLNSFKIAAAYQFLDSQYDCDDISIETPYVDENKYYSVDCKSIEDNKIGLMCYDLDQSSGYSIPASANDSKGIQIAQYNFTIDSSVETSKSIQFGFAGFGNFVDVDKSYYVSQSVDVMTYASSTVGGELLAHVPICGGEDVMVNTKNKNDGVIVADYRYAPEGYLLAIISKEHKDDEFLKYEDKPMYYTSNSNYISESTNPNGLKAKYLDMTSEQISALPPETNPKLGRVYLKLVNIQSLADEGLIDNVNSSYEEIAAAIEKKITICKVAEYKEYIKENNNIMSNCEKIGNAIPDVEVNYIFSDSDNKKYRDFESYMNSFNIENTEKLNLYVNSSTVSGEINPYDVDRDGIVDYNDASMVYKMLQNGGNIWSYDINTLGNYLGERGRLFAAAKEGNGIFYGTILDVMNIITNYSPEETE